jgi:hypothetical protein
MRLGMAAVANKEYQATNGRNVSFSNITEDN